LEIVRAPNPTAQVRLTNLRLATDLGGLEKLKRALEPLLPSLQLPVTTESVTQWTWDTLKEPEDRTKRRSEESDTQRQKKHAKTMVVSFAAAALLLLHDLDGKSVTSATSYETLVEGILNIAKIVQDLSRALDKGVERLSGLLPAKRKKGDGRRPDPGVKHYLALVLYRMGTVGPT
jgi:hypothetical protein